MQHHPTGSTPDAAAKAHLRAGVRAARRALDGAARADVDAGLARAALQEGSPLAAVPAGSAVALYASTPTEPGTRGLRGVLAARGLVVVLPVVVGRDAPLAWEEDDEAARSGGGGTGRPRPQGLEGVAVVLLPALAVAGDGVRLGQGGGHYDRTLVALPPACSPERPLLAAVVRDEEVLPAGALPREPHDVLVDAALTPTGWRPLDASGATSGDHGTGGDDQGPPPRTGTPRGRARLP